MLSLTRELNPSISDELSIKIHEWSKICFATVYGTGAPRIDYLCNQQTGEIWLNEVNPCPGSFGYFLWQASPHPMLFPEVLSALIDEAFTCQRSLQLPPDPTHPDARLFPRG
jgi:D-alanine-D-alanine ligase